RSQSRFAPGVSYRVTARCIPGARIIGCDRNALIQLYMTIPQNPVKATQQCRRFCRLIVLTILS
ncbi:MAG TPA: hypothetical protein VGC70_01455, partial [Burkholderiales bacterium]